MKYQSIMYVRNDSMMNCFKNRDIDILRHEFCVVRITYFIFSLVSMIKDLTTVAAVTFGRSRG
jgi:hypothetical protein